MSQSQDLVFTLYGDYIRHRGGEAWTGSLIELLGLLGLSDQAIRSTLSRMSRNGWLKSRKNGRFSFYSLTPKCVKLLEEGARRIFHPRCDPWDGQWYVLTYSIPESKRHLRRKLRRRLQWLGFGDLNHSTWIAPRDLQADVEHMVNALGVSHYVEYFAGAHRGFSNGEEILARCWNLKQLHRYYADLIARYKPLYKAYMSRMESNTGPDPEECFIQRFLLIHEYRSSPYVDPNLPLELLPDDWLGGRATELFQLLRGLLTGGAEAFVDEVFAKAPTSSDV